MGAWINESGYSPGKRHYNTGEVKRHFISSEHRNNGTYRRFQDIVTGEYLCTSSNIHSHSGYVYEPDKGGPGHKYGGLSVVEQVNLNQRNLCSYCVKRFVNEVRPDLLPAFNAMKTGVVT